MNEHYEKWDELAPRGLAIIGLGMSILGQGIVSKAKGYSFIRWMFWGVLGLVTINAGVSVFGEAVKHRALYDMELKRHETTNQPTEV